MKSLSTYNFNAEGKWVGPYGGYDKDGFDISGRDINGNSRSK